MITQSTRSGIRCQRGDTAWLCGRALRKVILYTIPIPLRFKIACLRVRFGDPRDYVGILSLLRPCSIRNAPLASRPKLGTLGEL
jgi:hypothetical protein